MILSYETGKMIVFPLHLVTPRELTDCPGHTVSKVGLVSTWLSNITLVEHEYNLETGKHTLEVPKSFPVVHL